MEGDEREHKAAEVLREDVQLEEAVGVAALLDVEHAPDLARDKRDVRVVAHNLELLLAVLVGHRPLGIVRPVFSFVCSSAVRCNAVRDASCCAEREKGEGTNSRMPLALMMRRNSATTDDDTQSCLRMIDSRR